MSQPEKAEWIAQSTPVMDGAAKDADVPRGAVAVPVLLADGVHAVIVRRADAADWVLHVCAWLTLALSCVIVAITGYVAHELKDHLDNTPPSDSRVVTEVILIASLVGLVLHAAMAAVVVWIGAAQPRLVPVGCGWHGQHTRAQVLACVLLCLVTGFTLYYSGMVLWSVLRQGNFSEEGLLLWGAIFFCSILFDVTSVLWLRQGVRPRN